VASGFMTDCQVDLADLKDLSRTNKGYKYMLVAIDVLSKRLFVEPLKSKNKEDMLIAFQNLIKRMPMKPMRIYSDLGSEFKNKLLKEYFEKEDILKYEASTATIKAALAERAIRNVKQRLYRYFSHNKTTTWINIYQKIVDGINHSKSRVHGMRPIDVNFKNAQMVWKRLYGNELTTKRRRGKPKFQIGKIFSILTHKNMIFIGDLVRVSRRKGIFEKGYIPSWSDVIYKIEHIKDQSRPMKYKISRNGQPLRGLYYGEELAKVREEADTNDKIQKVLRKRKLPDGTLEVLVKYVGREKPEWIHENMLV
jgi:hypothetical protein